MATTAQGKFEGLVRGPYGIAWEPDSPLYRAYASDSSWNTAHVNDPKVTAVLKEQRRTKDLETRRQLIFDIQRYAAEQQYYRLPQLQHVHGLLATVREELCSQPELRLRRSRRRAVAGSLGQPRSNHPGRLLSHRKHDPARMQCAARHALGQGLRPVPHLPYCGTAQGDNWPLSVVYCRRSVASA